MSFGNMRQRWPSVLSVVSWTWSGQGGDTEALKARCSISSSHLVFCSRSFSLLVFPRAWPPIASVITSSLSSSLRSLSGGTVTICHMAGVIGSRPSGRFWLTLHGPRTRRVTSRAQRTRMTERASHPWWKMLLVKLSPRPKAEKMGLLQNLEKVYRNAGEKHIFCPPLSVFIFTLHPPSATPLLYFYPL